MPRQNGDAAGPAGSGGGAPWHPRRLRQLLPSFRGILKLDTGPVAVAQRDEFGLLPGNLLTKLGFGAISPASSPQPTKPLGVAAAAVPQQQGAAAGPQAAAGVPRPREEQQDSELQLGRSPDSDECGERTGRHLMESFSSQQSPCRDGCACCERAPPESPAAAAERGCDAAQAGSPDAQQGDAASALAAPAGQQRQQGVQPGGARPAAAAAAAAGGEREGQHQHVTERPGDAYALPEHAQAAALLGQPAYMRALSIGSDTKPFRSPFVSELLHHSHPPPPGGAGDDAAASAAAAPPRSAAGSPQRGTLAGALAEACDAAEGPLTSSEAFWLREGEREGNGRDLSGLPFSVRNAPLLRVIPKFYGVAAAGDGDSGTVGDGRSLLELEDLARAYRHPCIVDIKVGFRTWYSEADPRYIERCKEKDGATTQAALGFKICGMQVYRHGAGGYWRASKRWCKTLPVGLADKALLSFAHNEHGLRPADVYGGPGGAIAQLEALEAWFAVQTEFRFYSSSVLLLYEGDARSGEDARVRVRLVDFAHTFYDAHSGGRDTNFLAGLRALLARLRAVVSATLAQDLAVPPPPTALPA